MRTPGFYRVLTAEDEWVIGRCVDGDENPMLADGWYLTGDDNTYEEEDFAEIGCRVEVVVPKQSTIAELRAELAAADTGDYITKLEEKVIWLRLLLNDLHPTPIQHSPVVRHKNAQRTTR
jgi:hypothetical protein